MADAQALEDHLKKLLLLFFLITPPSYAVDLHVTIIQGLSGNPEFSELFDDQVRRLQQAAGQLVGKDLVTTFSGVDATRSNVLEYFEQLNSTLQADDRLAVIMIGHGSYDGHEYKFNVPGPDITGEDLAGILAASPAGLQLIVNTSSASGAVIEQLKDDSRIIITATRSGSERNAPRFGKFFVDALFSYSADVNKNETISVAEAFEYANRETEEFYEAEGRLATEHPQLEGEHAARFNIARLTVRETVENDPQMEHLLTQKRNIDRLIEALQLRKAEMSNEDYFNELQQLILELSITEDMIEELQQDRAGNAD